ncbi:hypothetical protein [Streptodolium elevatio]|uniref:Uncharacterized protein n=1 Tax=Streptodolium elevatio TaxID=3157996 RepID=A0ABV3DIJ9_9ACTN
MQSQPKWAWWIVGIVIPVIGIVVTIWAANPSSDSGTADAGTDRPPAATGTGSGSRPGPTGPPQAAPPAADVPRKVLVGPVEVTIDGAKSYLELDTVPPMATQSNKSADVVALVNVGDPSLQSEGSTKTIGLLPPEGADPAPADCEEAVDKRGTYNSGELARGTRLCVETDEGHMAYLRVVSGVSISAPVRFQVTVWE